jgi:hypothetical protein
MHGAYFNNPIGILHRLKSAGYTEKQAEALVEVFSDYVENGLVTKADLKLELKDIRSELKELELRMTIKTAAIVASIVGFFSLLEKFF